MKKSKAFTLAEVLITLVIIGVIAAMTIPTLMGSTNKQEIKSRLKKVTSEVNQAIALEYALYGNKINPDDPNVDRMMYNMLSNHLSIVDRDEENLYLYAADGMFFHPQDWGGLNVSVDPSWRGVEDTCETPQECESANITYFHFTPFCGDSNVTKLCPSTFSAYSYVYDVSLQEAYDKFGGEVWIGY